MTEPTQEMLDAWAKIPKPKDRPYCRVCRSTDVTLFEVSTTTSRWGHSEIRGWHWEWDTSMPRSTRSMGCNECKTLDQPVIMSFSKGGCL